MATTVPEVADAATEARQYHDARSMITGKMPSLVKGAGFARPGGNKQLDDNVEIERRGMEAEQALRKSVKDGLNSPGAVTKSLSPEFASQFPAFMAQGAPSYNPAMQQLTEQLQQAFSELGKNVTLTSPLSSGFVPFDLLAPSRLIYPVYSPLRNKLPRVPGQGTMRRAKLVTGITGSNTGSSGGRFMRTSIPELVGGGSDISGTNWPLNLPASGAQDAVDLQVPYQFFGQSESLSWLSQFSGQGFEDISALANLILLQEFMMNEEASILSGRTAALGAVSAPTVVGNATTAPTGTVKWNAASIFVFVSAATLVGETIAASSGATAITVTANDYVHVTVPVVPGATHYNVYIGTSNSAAACHFAGTLGSSGDGYINGPAAPTTGPTAPTVDTSSAATDFDGLIAILAGQSTTHPAGWKAGYYNGDVGAAMSTDVIGNALQQLWNGPGAYRADPAELIAEGSDVKQLSDDMLKATGGQAAYRLQIEQSEVAGVRAGAAVSEFQNPITRNVVKILVHPWLPQGNAMLMSYTLPFVWSNVSNVFEMTMVQDYLSISWPVIDASFRYSIFEYGALVAYAPQYCGLLQGLDGPAAV